jgi:hypothetical protein
MPLSSTRQRPLEVADHPAFWWCGWFALTFLPLGVWLDWKSGQLITTPSFAFIAVLGLWLLLRYGRTQVDATYIRRSTPSASIK